MTATMPSESLSETERLERLKTRIGSFGDFGIGPFYPKQALGGPTDRNVRNAKKEEDGIFDNSGEIVSRSLPPLNRGDHAQAKRDRIDLEERVSIIVADGGISEPWAEGFAKLQALDAPEGIAEDGWRRLIDGVGRFLDLWGQQASALGWTEWEVLSVNSEADLSDLWRHGLAIISTGAKLVALSTNVATFETLGHAPHTLLHLRRTPLAPHMLWDLGHLPEKRGGKQA